MKILAYQGISWVSRIIRHKTRSIYSHIAVELNDGSVVEAWHKGGVRHSESFKTLHTKGTKVDVYEILCDYNYVKAEKFYLRQIGKGYDFGNVGRFLSGRQVRRDDYWFCSEYGEMGIIKGGGRLLRGSPSEHSPRDTCMSMELDLREQRVVESLIISI